jgi:hypothetical protein
MRNLISFSYCKSKDSSCHPLQCVFLTQKAWAWARLCFIYKLRKGRRFVLERGLVEKLNKDRVFV